MVRKATHTHQAHALTMEANIPPREMDYGGEHTLYINKEQLISNSVSILCGAKAMASYALSRLIRISAQLFACDFP